MIRTRSSVRRARIAIGVLIGVTALTACGGGESRQGAAAVIGGQRISIATVEARVTELRAAAAAQPGGPRTEQAGLIKRTVADLVLDQVVAKALADRQLEVSDGEIARVRDADTKLLGGDNELRRELLLSKSIPAGEINSFYRQHLGIQKLAAASGQDARTPEGDATVRAALTRAGTELNIVVNPRYGHWDAQQISLTDAITPWLPQPATAA